MWLLLQSLHPCKGSTQEDRGPGGFGHIHIYLSLLELWNGFRRWRHFFVSLTNSRNRLSNHCLSRQSRREYRAKYLASKVASVSLLWWHISYSVTLPITDIVYLIQWILKEPTPLISYLVLLHKDLADGLKRKTPFNFSSKADDRGTLVIRKVSVRTRFFNFTPGQDSSPVQNRHLVHGFTTTLVNYFLQNIHIGLLALAGYWRYV